MKRIISLLIVLGLAVGTVGAQGDERTPITSENAFQITILKKIESIALSVFALSPDGKTLALKGTPEEIWLYDTDTLEPLDLLGTHTGFDYLAWSGDGLWLASTGSSQEVLIWDIAERTLHLTIENVPFGNVVWSPDGKWLAAGNDVILNLYDATADFELTHSFDVQHSESSVHMRWSPDGRYLAFTDNYTKVLVWDSTQEEVIFEDEDAGWVQMLAWSPTSHYLAVANRTGFVPVWDIETGELLLNLEHYAEVWSAGWSPDEKRLVTTSNNFETTVWDLKTGEVQDIFLQTSNFAFASFSPDGQLVSIYDNDSIQLKSVETGEDLYLYKLDSGFSPRLLWISQGLFVTAGFDGSIRFWGIGE